MISLQEKPGYLPEVIILPEAIMRFWIFCRISAYFAAFFNSSLSLAEPGLLTVFFTTISTGLAALL